MAQSVRFELLEQGAQIREIQKIAAFDQATQEKLCAFFEQENAKEQEKMAEISQDRDKAIYQLMQEVERVDKLIKRLAVQDLETQDRQKDEDKQSSLLNQLNQI